MSDIEFVTTYFVTFEADEYLVQVSNLRQITLAATTTDPEDAQVLAYSDLADEFGVEVAKHLRFIRADKALD